MTRIPAANSNSGNIVSYGWHPDSAITELVGVLEIEFAGRKGGAPSVYAYANVPNAKWLGLLQAPSAGAFINAEIKGVYSCTKVS